MWRPPSYPQARLGAGMRWSLGFSIAALLQTLVIALSMIPSNVVASGSTPSFLGGPGYALFFNDPKQYGIMADTLTSPDGEYTVTGFPSRALTIEYWIRTVYRADYNDQLFLLFGYGSEDVITPTGDRVYDDNVVQCCAFVEDNRQVLYILPSLSGAKPVSTHADAEYRRDFTQWHHYAITFDAMRNASYPSTVYVYRDGEIIMKESIPEYGNASIPSTGTFVLAQDQDSVGGGFDPAQSFVGMLDELRIWNIARSQSEIRRDMNAELHGDEANLWAYYPFNEGVGGIAYNKVNASRYPIRLGVGADVPSAPNQKPLWAISRAPVAGQLPMRALANRGSLGRVDFSVLPVSVNVTIGSISTSSCAGTVEFFSDDAGSVPLADNAVLPPGTSYAFARIATGAPSPFVTCNVSYTVATATGSGVEMLVIAENRVPIVTNVTVTFDEDSEGVFPLLAVDSEIIAAVVITSIPKHGTLYALTTRQERDFAIIANNTPIFTSGGPVSYFPTANSHGLPFDTFTYHVIDMSGGVSGEATVTINIAPVDDLPVAGNNPYSLDFIRVGQSVVLATLDPTNANATFSVAFYVKMSALPSAAANNYTLVVFPASGLSGARYELSITHDGRIRFVVGSATVDADFTPFVGDKWTHVTVGVAQWHAVIHVNGSVVANGTISSRPVVPPGALIGGFVGALDEFCVYGSLLDARDVNVIRDVKRASLGGKLLGCFCFDEGLGLTAKCTAGEGGSCPHEGRLGNGDALRAPLWALQPLVVADSYASFPLFETTITEEEKARVITLKAIDVDTDPRGLSLVVLTVPAAGTLYQYEEQAPDKRGGKIDPYLFWRNTIEPVTIWPVKAYKAQNQSCCNSTDAFFALTNAITRTPCKLCGHEDPTLTFSTQFSFAIYGVFALLHNEGRPSRYNPYASPLFGYGDNYFSYCSVSPGDIDRTGVRDCANRTPGDTVQNPFQWSCPHGTENEFFEVGFAEPLYLQSVTLYENYYPGAVVSIRARVNGTAGEWVDVWSGLAQTELYDSRGNYIDGRYRIFDPPTCNTPFLVDALHVELATHKIPGWNEIESIAMTGTRALKDGVVTDPNGRVVYVPNKYANGIDEFEFTAFDCPFRRERSAVNTRIRIDVTPVNNAPVTSSPHSGTPIAVIAGTPISFALQAMDFDGGETMYFALTTVPRLGTLSPIGGGGSLSISSGLVNAGPSRKLVPSNLTLIYNSLNSRTCGDDSFSYYATDGTLTSAVVTVRLAVVCAAGSDTLNLVPIIVPIALSFVALIVAFLVAMGHASLRRKREIQRLQRLVVDYKELQVMEQLSEGAFGVVFRAEFRGTDVAIKMLKAQVGTSGGTVLSDSDSSKGKEGSGRGGGSGSSNAHTKCTARVTKVDRTGEGVDANGLSQYATKVMVATAEAGRKHDDGGGKGLILAMLSTLFRTVVTENKTRAELADFLGEIDIMCKLRHPNIVLFMGCCDKPCYVIIQEFLAGGSVLDAFARQPKWSLAMRVQMAVDAARGMAYLHSNTPPILHLDLKSPNLLLDRNLVVKVADFGLARVLVRYSAADTSVGQVGSLHWMAPEIMQGEAKCYTWHADSYSFGIVLAEFITMERPYQVYKSTGEIKTNEELLMKICLQDLRPKLPDTCPLRLSRLARECWDFRPAHRPQFDAILHRLTDILNALSNSNGGDDDAPPMPFDRPQNFNINGQDMQDGQLLPVASPCMQVRQNVAAAIAPGSAAVAVPDS